ncbi:MAG: hypothetical protein D6E12_01145 [Desulfovibrio sp.]|nr:MAG: hypothetical protein D6E12_01145 [Desulfovibrio sp.]
MRFGRNAPRPWGRLLGMSPRIPKSLGNSLQYSQA